MTCNCAIIGAGRSQTGFGIGHFILREVLQNKQAKLIAYSGWNKEELQKSLSLENIRTQEALNNAQSFSKEECASIFNIELLDLIIIASPSDTHLQWLEMAIKNKLHVLVEKPLLGLNSSTQNAQLASLFKQAKEQGLLIATNCQRATVVDYLSKPPFKHISCKLTIPAKQFLNYTDLFSLLISHPISVLVKYGLLKESIKNTAFHIEKNNTYQSITIQFSYTFQAKERCVKFILAQSLLLTQTSMAIQFDQNPSNTFSVYKNKLEEVSTLWENGSSKQLIDDFLSVSVNKTIAAVLNQQAAPLMNNQESWDVFQIEQYLFSEFTKNVEVQDA